MELLKGIRVASFNHFLFGPVGMQILGDLGADVIAVEPPDGAFQRKWGGVGSKSIDGQTMLFLLGNRNKRSIAIDLKSSDGLEIARRLTAEVDVVCENYRPGVMDKFGLGYESVAMVNPSVIYASASGFGASGPYVERPGQDLLVQAMSGLAAITGGGGLGPRPVGVSIVDHHAASLLAMGVLAALFRRAKTGAGCKVDVNLLSAAIDLQQESFTCYLNGERPASVSPSRYSGGWYFEAPYGIYATADAHIAISLTKLETLAAALQVPELARFKEADAYEKREQIIPLVASAVASRSLASCIEVLQAHDIWHTAVNDYEAVRNDPQVRHNGTFVTQAGATGAPVTLVAHPIKYDGQSPAVRVPPQPIGAQSTAILLELGYDAARIEDLKARGVVIEAGYLPATVPA